MKRKIWEIRIPTIFAFVVIAASIYLTLFLVQKGVFIVGKAAPVNEPLNLTFANITDTSFRVGFTTNEKVTAAVKVVTPNGDELIQFDDRDSKGDGKYFSHVATFKDLSPKSTYSVSVLIEGKTYPENNKVLTVVSAPFTAKPQTDSQLQKVEGTIMLSNGEKADDSLVTIDIDGAQTLLTLSINGNYSFDFTTLRTQDLQEFFMPSKKSGITINAYNRNQNSSLTALFENSASLPPITISEVYSLLESAPTPTVSIPTSDFLIPTPNKKSSGQLAILTPTNNQSFIDSQPIFAGTAFPNKDVLISLALPNQINAKVLSDNLGFWTFRPASPLTQGTHMITVTAADAFGIKKSVNKSFTIFASGSQVTESATPSATPLPTLTQPTATPTPIKSGPTPLQALPTATPLPTSAQSTPSPTLIVIKATATPLPTIAIPTNTPTPTPFLSITPTSPGSMTSVLVTLVSVVFIFIGTTLLFILS